MNMMTTKFDDKDDTACIVLVILQMTRTIQNTLGLA